MPFKGIKSEGNMWKYLLLLLVATVALAADEHPTLALQSQAPNFSLPGVDGKIHKLTDYNTDKVLVVIFTCNHCPIAQMYEERIAQLVADFGGRSVGIVAIQPNDPNAIRVDELDSSDVSDSLEEMKIRAAYKRIGYPYLYDGDTQAVARAYGPKATPHVFVFDRQRKLRYEGRFDDSYRLENVKTQDARNAVEAILADKPVLIEHTS
jgi:thiol-disulfide isomerase/thioredoxin